MVFTLYIQRLHYFLVVFLKTSFLLNIFFNMKTQVQLFVIITGTKANYLTNMRVVTLFYSIMNRQMIKYILIQLYFR